MGGNAIKMPELIDSHAQCDANFGVERAGGESADEVIDLGLIAETTENNFTGKPGIARVERGGLFQQNIGCIAAFDNAAKYVECDLAGGGHQVLFYEAAGLDSRRCGRRVTTATRWEHTSFVSSLIT